MNEIATSPLLIVGASARAAAQSAHRAGFQPYAIDLFGDRDLQRTAESRVSTNYPTDILCLAKQFPEVPFLYTGALENFPELLDELSQQRLLWGNPSRVIKHVRDPFLMQAILKQGGFPTIPVRRHDDPPGDESAWLMKPYDSGHGFGIATASGQPVRSSHYFQRRIEGESIGAVYLSAGKECRLLGTHQQLAGLQESVRNPFRFCGAVAPAVMSPEVNRRMAGLGSILTQLLGLQGLFGCDFLVNSDGPHLLEVNPRYTAAMELWESLGEPSLIAQHVAACRDRILLEQTHEQANGVALKLILYTPADTRVPDNLEGSVGNVPNCRLADLPAAHSLIERDHPLCTLLVSADSWNAAEVSLQTGIESVAASCGWGSGFAQSLYRQTDARIRTEFT